MHVSLIVRGAEKCRWHTLCSGAGELVVSRDPIYGPGAATAAEGELACRLAAYGGCVTSLLGCGDVATMKPEQQAKALLLAQPLVQALAIGPVKVASVTHAGAQIR